MPQEFIEIEHGSARYREALGIRDRILRAPLGLRFDDDEIAAESKDFHLAAVDWKTGAVIACLVLSPIDDRSIDQDAASRRG